jgi:hypothetical protein
MKEIITKIIPYVFAVVLIFLLCFVIYKQVKEHHLQDDPVLKILKEILKPVHPIFNKLKLYRGDKSYTINKEKTFLCLYDENGDYYPINMLIYVLLHEVAHSINTKDIGHTEEFHRIFDELLDRATQIGVYNPSIPIIQNYCNHE